MKRILVLTAIFGLAAILHATRPDTPGPSSDCEPISAGIVRQPGNAATSLALIGAGLVLVLSDHKSRRLLGTGVLLAGASSLAAHATQHPVALTADGVAVSAALTLGSVALTRATSHPRRLAAAALLGSGAIALWASSRRGGPLCDPDALISGHAAWHVLIALAVLIAASSLTDRDSATNF